jgi:ribosomal protein S18 acetylase RimI-like enzyme
MAAPSLIATTNTCNAFSVTNVQNRNGVASSTTTSLQMAEATASDVKMVPSNGSPEEMDLAASFMVDAFWLNSPQGLCLSGDAAPDGAMLLQEQAHDFNEKYGEIMGSRVLNTMLIQAMGENSALLGLVGIEVSLLDKTVGDIVSATKSQDLLKMAVASLGPKERRTYKKATVQEICTELLPPHLEAVVVLSNLVVSPQARRRGIAKQLCQEAERMAGSWGYDALYLRVEAGNEAARTLYEKLLGFDTKYELPEAIGIRIDDGGKFVEVDAPTLVLSKSL